MRIERLSNKLIVVISTLQYFAHCFSYEYVFECLNIFRMTLDQLITQNQKMFQPPQKTGLIYST